MKHLTILLYISIYIAIAYKLIFIEPKGEITSEILYALGLLVILVLNESFESFSIGSIISLKRKVKEKTEKITQITYENVQLRNQLISMMKISSYNKNQSSLIVHNNMHPISATTDEINKSQQVDEPKNQRERIDQDKIKKKIISDYLKTEDYQQNIKLVDRNVITHSEFDPISLSSPIYDAYFNKYNQELFFYIIHIRMIQLNRDKLYSMLTKLYHYRENNRNQNIKMVVFLVKSQNNNDIYEKNKIFLEQEFRPAILNGLLEIIEKEIDIEEYKI